MKPQGPDAPARLTELDGEAGRLLRALPPADPPEGARARVWRGVAAGMGTPRARRWPWLLLAPAAAAALSVAVLVSLRPGRTEVAQPPVLALTSGPVEVLSPFRVKTGPRGAALLRVGRAALLLDQNSEIEVQVAEVVVFGGRVAVSTLGEGPLVLRAGDQSFSRTGELALLVDSSRVELQEITPGERRLLDALARPAPAEAVLAVEAPPGYEVGMDGVPLGWPPVRVLAAPGVRRLVGRGESSDLTLDAEVRSGLENRYVLRPPAQPDPETRREPIPPPPPPVRPHRAASPGVPAPMALAPSPPPAAPPAPVEAEVPATGGLLAPEQALRARISSAVSGQDRDAASYSLAKLLLEQGRYPEAAGLFGDVARGQSSRAELSLYELGRLNLRHLKDPAAAATAFQGYLDRYPRGLLEQEVELSLMESQLSSGALERAGESMDRFLQRHPGSERRHEVLLLRANLDRDRGDCAGALERYRALFQVPGTIGDDATYFAAVCAQRAGRADEARRLLEQYLAKFPSGRHREAAERALR